MFKIIALFDEQAVKDKFRKLVRKTTEETDRLDGAGLHERGFATASG